MSGQFIGRNGSSGLSLAARFWSFVDQSGECWIWTGTHSIGGRYGAIRVDRRMRPAHVVAYEMTVGSVPEGRELDHTCRTILCVRPTHLEPVTHRENVLRGVGPTAINARKTRCTRGHFLPATRVCRPCANGRNRRHRARRAA